MTLLRAGSVPFEAELVVFDKDGTLIDFEFMWGRLAAAWMAWLTAETGNEALQQALCLSWGYDWQRQRTKPESPLSIATTKQVQTIAAAVLYRHGIPWTEAEDVVRSAFLGVAADLPLADLVRATGDVSGLLVRLRGAGVRVAVITTDHRAETEEALRVLHIDHLVDHLFCGDDGVPCKPAPDTLLITRQRLGVVPERTVVVGDTVADLLMGRRAGAGLVVAVLTGAGGPAQLKTHADVVVASIDEITIKA
jgi:phosphoglycolate phosphatase-like HAD superfamily hydrolase